MDLYCSAFGVGICTRNRTKRKKSFIQSFVRRRRRSPHRSGCFPKTLAFNPLNASAGWYTIGANSCDPPTFIRCTASVSPSLFCIECSSAC